MGWERWNSINVYGERLKQAATSTMFILGVMGGQWTRIGEQRVVKSTPLISK